MRPEPDWSDLAGLTLFFFSSRRGHTRCLSDWSSDVCSSDLSPTPQQCGGVGEGLRKIDAGGRRLEENGRAAGRGRVEISGGRGFFKKKKTGPMGGMTATDGGHSLGRQTECSVYGRCHRWGNV